MFYKIASLLYNVLPKGKNRNTKTMDMLVLLCPEESENSLKRRHGVEKIKKVLEILTVGSVVALFLWISEGSRGFLINGSYILRAGQGEGERKLLLTARREDGEKTEAEITVRESRFSDEELEALYENMLKEADRKALGENASWDKIEGDLFLMHHIDGFPFILSWESSDHRYVTSGGRVARWEEIKEAPKPSKPVALTLRAEYYDFVREYTFFAGICPAERESFREKAEFLLKQAEEEAPQKDRVVLPKIIAGEKVVWTEKREHTGRNVFLVTLVGALAVWLLYDRELQKRVAARKRQIAGEYMVVISKLSLYLGAGMNLKGAWKKVAEEGNKNEPVNPVYEEMRLTCREMEDGVPEAAAYERFGKRIRLQRYIRLTTLLVQNLRKGNAELLLQLGQEAFLATEERSLEVKRAGEEMGTKLLFPMLLMMGMIMALILVPAFFSL